MRKTLQVLVVAAVLLALPLFNASAQICQIFTGGGGVWVGTDTLACDTVRIGCPQITASVIEGDSIAIPVYLWTDETVGGFSLGFTYNYDFVEITSVSSAGSAIPAPVILLTTFKPDDNQVLIGWLDFTGFGNVPVTGQATGKLLFTMYMKVLPGASTQRINVDSVFVPPAGPFELTVNHGTPTKRSHKIVPVYSDCGTRDVLLPVYESEGEILPESFELGQNNPNPFNPSTSIDFALPKSANVKVEIFNILGQKVKTVVDEYLSAGYKKVTWDGTDNTGKTVASGVYLYRMTADDFTATKKMMLMK